MFDRPRLTRREFTRGAATICAATALGGWPAPAAPPGPQTSSRSGANELDAALELLARRGPEYGGGLSNHGPMACEALMALGRPNAVIPWVEQYQRRLQSPPRERKRILRDSWREALSQIDRVGDWMAFFDRELGELSWKEVLAKWVPLLAPGLVGAATHGLIRTGHAVHGLAQSDNAVRRHELAQGLAYWAARYHLLPAASPVAAAGLKPAEALKRVEPLPHGDSVGGPIANSLHRLDQQASFASVLHLIDTTAEPSALLSELTETFAHVYLANAAPPDGRVITFIHTVTGPSALRMLLPHLTPDSARAALRYGWQAAAALYAVLGTRGPGNDGSQQKIDPEELVQRAIDTGDEHAIKFTEACLREHGVYPKPVYLEAAWDAVKRLSG